MSEGKTINLGILGFGTVGKGTYDILIKNRQQILARHQVDLNIAHVCCRRDDHGIDPSIQVSSDFMAVVNDPAIDVVLELMGGVDAAKTAIEAALNQGKHVVTANKDLLALHGNALFALAKSKGLSLAYEAAIAGGIPIVETLSQSLSANHVNKVVGIINGTCNYILTEMVEKGLPFDEVLSDAQALGYAEADPSGDVDGFDAAYKITLLSALAFSVPIDFSQTYIEGIRNVTADDFKYADKLGYQIKHVGICKKILTEDGKPSINVRVHPALISKRQMLSHVSGVMNAVSVYADAVGELFLSGPGAGAMATGSAVCADVVAVAKGLTGSTGSEVTNESKSQLPEPEYLPMSKLSCAYYLRIHVKNESGVLALVSQILSDSGVSIESVIQEESEGPAHIALITSKVQESLMLGVLAELEKAEQVIDPVAFIRLLKTA